MEKDNKGEIKVSLRKIMLLKKKEQATGELQALNLQDEELSKREKEIEAAIDEVKTEEEQKVVDEEIEDFEGEKEDLTKKKEALEKQIDELDKELDELEDKDEDVINEPIVDEKREAPIQGGFMEMRAKYFGGLNRAEVEELTKRAEVKEFLDGVRDLKMQKRGLTGGELAIPNTLIGLLKENITEFSVLAPKVNYKSVKGKSRMLVSGKIPEAIWTEACANLNELDIDLKQVEVDGYKVGGFIPICNATLADATDVELYQEVMSMLAKSIAFALDKAILYGTGNKMPLGMVAKIAPTAMTGYPTEGIDKDKKHVNEISAKTLTGNYVELQGENLIKQILTKVAEIGATKTTPDYFSASGEAWIMNKNTFRKLQAETLTTNAEGAIVSGINNTMPIIGGDVIITPAAQAGHIIYGAPEAYLLAEREGMSIQTSSEVRFIQDETVFKGTARYDGQPVLNDEFVLFDMKTGGQYPTFPEDKANKNPAA